jgi:hypothetical protein
LIKYELPREDILLLDITRQYVVTRGFFLAYQYSRFYLEQGDAVPPQEDISAAMLGLLFNTVDYTQVLPGNNEFQLHCEKAGFVLIFRIINDEDEILRVADDPIVQGLLLRFADGARSFISNRAQQMIMLGPILLTMGKNISPEGYMGWMTRGVRAMMGTLRS